MTFDVNNCQHCHDYKCLVYFELLWPGENYAKKLPIQELTNVQKLYQCYAKQGVNKTIFTPCWCFLLSTLDLPLPVTVSVEKTMQFLVGSKYFCVHTKHRSRPTLFSQNNEVLLKTHTFSFCCSGFFSPKQPLWPFPCFCSLEWKFGNPYLVQVGPPGLLNYCLISTSRAWCHTTLEEIYNNKVFEL